MNIFNQIWATFGAVIGTIIITLLILLSFLWLIFPFTILQIKHRLDRLIVETKAVRKAVEKSNSLSDNSH